MLQSFYARYRSKDGVTRTEHFTSRDIDSATQSAKVYALSSKLTLEGVWHDNTKYKVVRMYRDTTAKRTIQRGLTLAEAKAHCGNPETSSSTCTKPDGISRTRRKGPWFDGYEKE